MEYFREEPINERITRILMPGHVYSYLVEGRDRAAVIDCGCGLGSFRTYIEARLQGKPYDLILTHGHVDHAGGASEFDCVWLTEADFGLASRHTQKEIRRDYLRRSQHEFDETKLVEPKTVGYAALAYGQCFDLGGEILEVLCLGGHTRGSVGILFADSRILLTGDACCSYTLLFGNGDSLPIRSYRQNLASAWDTCRNRFDSLLYSHPHNWGGPELFTQMIRLCNEILSGKDDRIPTKFIDGSDGFLAKAIGENHRRVDGGLPNIVYAGDLICDGGKK